jgi:hypothetical protein
MYAYKNTLFCVFFFLCGGEEQETIKTVTRTSTAAAQHQGQLGQAASTETLETVFACSSTKVKKRGA